MLQKLYNKLVQRKYDLLLKSEINKKFILFLKFNFNEIKLKKDNNFFNNFNLKYKK